MKNGLIQYGDLYVVYTDVYIQIKDTKKDIIIIMTYLYTLG